jgi:hypothetical protein
MRENFDELGTQSSELILLDKLVQVGRKTLKHQTKVFPVSETLVHSKDMVLVVFVPLIVELKCQHLGIFLCQTQRTKSRIATSILL